MNVNSDLGLILKVVDGNSSIDHSLFFENVRSIELAGEQDIAFVFDPEDNSVFPQLSLDKIKNSKAGMIIASRPWVDGKNYIIVDDPISALHKIASFKNHCHSDVETIPRIHPSSVIASNAKVSDTATIGANVVIESGVTVGDRSVVGPNSFIGRNTTIGESTVIYPHVSILYGTIVGSHTIIHAGAVIGSDGFGYRVMKSGLRKEPQVGIVRIGNNVEIGANTAIDRATFEETVISDGVKIDNHVQIAHNVHIGQGTAILALTGIAGGVRIGKACQIGGLVAIRDHVVIEDRVKIVSKSGVMNSLKDGEVVAGIPSMPFGKWKRLVVTLLKLHELEKEIRGSRNESWWKKCKRFWGLVRSR